MIAMDGQGREDLLKQVISFRDLSEPAIARLASLTKTAVYRRDHVFNSGAEVKRAEHHVRVVLEGTVAVVQRGIGQDSRHLAGPGSLFSLNAVTLLAPDRHAPDQVRFSEATLDRTWVLELDVRDLDANANPHDAEITECILAARRVWAWLPNAAAALAKTKFFRTLRPHQMHTMIQYGRVVGLQSGTTLGSYGVAGQDPSAFGVVLSGEVVPVLYKMMGGGRSYSAGLAVTGSVVGLHELVTEEPSEVDHAALGWSTVMIFDRDDLLKLPHVIPAFARSIERAGGLPRMWAKGNSPRGWATAFFATKATYDRVPTHQLVDQVARDIASRFGERVQVVRVLTAEGQFAQLTSDPGVDVVYWELGGLPPPLFLRADVILIDATAVSADPTQQLDVVMGSAAALPLQVATFFERVGEREQIAARIPLDWRTFRVPIAVVAPIPPQDPVERIATSWLDTTFGSDGPIPESKRTTGGSILRRVLRGFASVGGSIGRAVKIGLDAEEVPSWPLKTVRVVLSKRQAREIRTLDLPATAPGAFEDIHDVAPVMRSVERVSRAVTRRKVGLAIGGAGVLSYSGIALIEALEERGVPIDVLSGTSGGTLVASVYGQVGSSGFSTLLKAWPVITAALASSYPTTAPLAWAVNLLFGTVPLNQTPRTVMPVATVAWDMREYAVRGGSVGEGSRVSGSLPPFAPTIRGDLRLLDGGLVADVPARILADEGVDLIIAASPWTLPPPIEPPPMIPFLTRAWLTSSQLMRMVDSMRGYNMSWKLAARSQLEWADVVYVADSARWASSGLFMLGEEIVREAAESDALQNAADAVARRWLELTLPPQPLLRLAANHRTLLMAGQIEFADGTANLTRESLILLAAVDDWCVRHPLVEGLVGNVRGDGQLDARAAAIRKYLPTMKQPIILVDKEPARSGDVSFAVTLSAHAHVPGTQTGGAL